MRVVRTGGISDPLCQRQSRHHGISDPRVDVLIDHDVGWFLTLSHTTVGARRFIAGLAMLAWMMGADWFTDDARLLAEAGMAVHMAEGVDAEQMAEVIA